MTKFQQIPSPETLNLLSCQPEFRSGEPQYGGGTCISIVEQFGGRAVALGSPPKTTDGRPVPAIVPEAAPESQYPVC